MKTRVNKHRQGFSLLELLVALAILLIAMIPIAYFYTRAASSISEQVLRARALELCRERAAEIQAMSYENIRANNDPGAIVNAYVNGATPIDQEDFPIGSVFNRDIPATSKGIWDSQDPNIKPQTGSTNQPLPMPPVFNFPLPAYNAGTTVPDARISSKYGGNYWYNPYDPDTWGYWVESPSEYEPVGFYAMLSKSSDGRLSSPVRKPIIDAPVDGGDNRIGNTTSEKYYELFGRRTIIRNLVLDSVDDNDGDNRHADDPLDGGADALNPYPLGKGPFNKFDVISTSGTQGKLVTIQVFWLKKGSTNGYVRWEDMNHVELPLLVVNTNNTLSVNGSTSIGASNYISTPPPAP